MFKQCWLGQSYTVPEFCMVETRYIWEGQSSGRWHTWKLDLRFDVLNVITMNSVQRTLSHRTPCWRSPAAGPLQCGQALPGTRQGLGLLFPHLLSGKENESQPHSVSQTKVITQPHLTPDLWLRKENTSLRGRETSVHEPFWLHSISLSIALKISWEDKKDWRIKLGWAEVQNGPPNQGRPELDSSLAWGVTAGQSPACSLPAWPLARGVTLSVWESWSVWGWLPSPGASQAQRTQQGRNGDTHSP